MVSPASASAAFINSDAIKVKGITTRTLKSLKHGMSLVVNGVHGTAKVARMPGMQVCGKTGTAQNPHGESHAWFIGFAPMDHPEIALCILVENGGSGGAVAAPVAKGVLKKYFETNLFAQRQDLR
jgi:cell division protein FtsI/penicillin-binding protein 2